MEWDPSKLRKQGLHWTMLQCYMYCSPWSKVQNTPSEMQQVHICSVFVELVCVESRNSMEQYWITVVYCSVLCSLANSELSGLWTIEELYLSSQSQQARTQFFIDSTMRKASNTDRSAASVTSLDHRKTSRNRDTRSRATLTVGVEEEDMARAADGLRLL